MTLKLCYDVAVSPLSSVILYHNVCMVFCETYVFVSYPSKMYVPIFQL